MLYQQLAGSAARAIEARLHARFGGRVLDARRLAPLDDDAVVEPVTVVRGVGPWTAHRLLMFSLGRPDVLPAGDSTACAMAR